jgi:hypothetical protein
VPEPSSDAGGLDFTASKRFQTVDMPSSKIPFDVSKSAVLGTPECRFWHNVSAGLYSGCFLLHPNVQHFDENREPHREIDIVLREMNMEALCHQRGANEQ